jgi:hypothetical protein
MKPIGARIAEIAAAEVGNTACGPNKVDGGDYYTSCANHHKAEAWCADFAKWVWFQAGALNTDLLSSAAASFGAYGRVRRKPKVGDAILLNYDSKAVHADHVAIVVKIFADGNIASIGGNERTPDGEVAGDPNPQSGAIGYSGAIGSKSYWGMKITGYVSPVEDDMPYSKKDIVGMVKNGVMQELRDPGTKTEILNLVKKGVAAELRAASTREEVLNLVKKGVAAELRAGIGASGVTAARGAEAAVGAKDALDEIKLQLATLKDMVVAVEAALGIAPSPPGPAPAAPGSADGSDTTAQS